MFNLQLIIWWWQLVESDRWTKQSITKMGWFVNIRSKHEADCSVECVGFEKLSVRSNDVLLSTH